LAVGLVESNVEAAVELIPTVDDWFVLLVDFLGLRRTFAEAEFALLVAETIPDVDVDGPAAATWLTATDVEVLADFRGLLRTLVFDRSGETTAVAAVDVRLPMLGDK